MNVPLSYVSRSGERLVLGPDGFEAVVAWSGRWYLVDCKNDWSAATVHDALSKRDVSDIEERTAVLCIASARLVSVRDIADDAILDLQQNAFWLN